MESHNKSTDSNTGSSVYRKFFWQVCASLTAATVAVFFSGCAATRTSPETVDLGAIQKKLVTSPTLPPRESRVVVGIRYPAGFGADSTKMLMVQKVNEMMTQQNKKGAAKPDPYMAWQFFPDEAAYKSLAASLKLRGVLATSSNISVFLVPCNVVETNGQLAMVPTVTPPPVHAMVDVNILNVVVNHQHAPWFKWQGCNMSRFLSPMVSVTLPGEGGGKVVAGTRRWLTKDNELAVVLPSVLERRYTGTTYGLFMNYPIVKPNQSGFPAVNVSRPAGESGYYELDSFVKRSDKEADFGVYWNFVGQIVAEVVSSEPSNPAEMAKTYARNLGGGEVAGGKETVAKKFMEAEWKFLKEADDAKVVALQEAKWFEAVAAMSKSEDNLLKSAKSRHFWNQVGQFTMAFAGAAAAGAGAAAATQSGTYYNSAPTTMMTMGAIQALGEAGGKEQLAALSSYRSVVATTETNINAVSLGLGEEAAGSVIKSIEDIRQLARKYLLVGLADGSSRPAQGE